MDIKPSIPAFINTKGIHYTEDQERAITETVKWAKYGTDTVHMLKGPAGSGKTTILGEIVNNLNMSVAVSAPTHRAVRQIAQSTGLPAMTIHKALGLYPNFTLENFDPNNPKFDPKGKQAIAEVRLFIIDESSMIPEPLAKLIQTIAKNNKVKVLYVGDPYQLPPIVKGSFAPRIVVFDYPGTELTTIVRQEDTSPILRMVKLLRTDVKNNTSHFLNHIYKYKIDYDTETNEGYMATKSGNHFSELMYDKYSSPEYFTNLNYVKYLAFTRNAISQANTYVRNKIINSTDLLCKDDLLIAYSSILDEFNALVITNSDHYLVAKGELYPFIQDGIPGYLTKLQNAEDGSISNMLFIVDTSNPEAVSAYLKMYNPLINRAKSALNHAIRAEAWQKFYEFKRTCLLMQSLVYEGTLITGNDFDYGHAMTIHKSQGSTYDNAFMQVRDIIYTSTGALNPNINLRNRLLYVALSRARKSVMMYI